MGKNEKGAVLKNCRRCAVYTPKGQRLPEARVVHTGKDIILYLPEYKLSDTRFRTRVDFYDDRQGLVMALCEVVIRRNPAFPQMDEPWSAECNILDVKQTVQRQKDIRVEVSIETEFVKSDGTAAFYGTIKNLSAGGIYMASRQRLLKGERVKFSYNFRNLERPFEVEILRVGRDDGGGWGYGCRFVGLTDKGEEAVRGYVYKKQQEKRQEKK